MKTSLQIITVPLAMIATLLVVLVINLGINAINLGIDYYTLEKSSLPAQAIQGSEDYLSQ